MRGLCASALALFVLASCDSGSVAGGSTSETSNGLVVQVVDTAGRPVAAARVRVRPTDYLETDAPASQDRDRGIVDTIADDSGFVVLPRRLERGRLEVFDAAGAAQALLEEIETRTAKLRLAPTCKVRGKVALKPGDIRARIQVRGLEHATWTDGAGFFQLDRLPSGPLDVRAWIPRRAASVETRHSVAPGALGEAGTMEPASESGKWADSVQVVLDTRSGRGAISTRVDSVPLLLHLLGDDFPTTAKPGGEDLRVTDSAGNAMSFYVASWSAATLSARIWVLVPSVRPSDTTQWFRLRWGNPAAEAASDPWSVFSARSGWSGVWNMSRTYVDRLGRRRVPDATSWSSDGVLSGSPTMDPEAGLRFGGAGKDGLAISGAGVNLTGSFTVLVHAKPEVRGAVLLGRGDSSWDHGKKWFLLQDRGATRRIPGWHPAFMGWADTGYNVYSVSNTPVDSARWTFLAARHSAEGAAVEWFVDGSNVSTTLTKESIYEGDRARDSLFVGHRHGSANGFRGSMSEIWILSSAVSDDWIRLQAACRVPGSGLVRIRR
jgi:hypothetical protein